MSLDSNLVVQQVNEEYETREGHMAKYLAMVKELMTFDIEYRPRPAIKAQALANFIADGVRFQETSEQDQRPWVLVVDGSSTSGDGGAGLMIRGPNGRHGPMSCILSFEHLITRLNMRPC